MNLLEKRQGHQETLCQNYGALRLNVQRGIVFFCISAFKKAVLVICVDDLLVILK